MTFESWLKKQIKRNDSVGDLANDFISAKKTYPERGVKCTKEHLDRWYAIPEAYEALEQAKNEYANKT